VLIAEKVMGLEDIFNVANYWYYNNDLRFPLPCYSKFIADAWLVVEKLRENGLTTHISICKDGPTVSIDEPTSGMVLAEEEEEAPLTICIAALKAFDVEVE
jgi:hypothetical protein